jgi:Rod binding domain-containing protein
MNIPTIQPHIDASEIAPERLAKNPQLTDQQKIGEASRQFESILLKQILDSSQKTVIKSKFAEDSTSSGIYHDMVTTRLADSISKSGSFGLAKTFNQQLNRAPSARPDGLPSHQELSLHTHLTLKPLHHAAENTNDATPSHSMHPFHGGEENGTAGAAVQRLDGHNPLLK